MIHSFFVPAFRIKYDVLPGRYTNIWFQATKTGEFPLHCAEYCGTEHAEMIGKVIVMEPSQFQAWLAGGQTGRRRSRTRARRCSPNWAAAPATGQEPGSVLHRWQGLWRHGQACDRRNRPGG